MPPVFSPPVAAVAGARAALVEEGLERPEIITFRPRQMADVLHRLSVMSGAGDELSDRELAVVRCVVEGLTNRQIAEQLAVSRRTVQAHLANAMKKTETATRTQLAVYALRRGLVPLTPHEPDDED